jgi:hypothetical protein
MIYRQDDLQGSCECDIPCCKENHWPIVDWIKELKLFTSLFWLFFSGLNPFYFLLHDVCCKWA